MFSVYIRVCDPHRIPSFIKRREEKLQNSSIASCLIYSIGSGGKFQFEDGMHEILGGLCEIHVFDPGNWTKDRPDLVSKNIHFHKWGLSSSYDKQYKPVVKYGSFFSLQDTMQLLGHVGRTIDIFKIDCESCEWASFQDWFTADIRILLVETHSLPAKTQTALDFFYGFQNANFFLYHKEPNIHPRAKGEGIEWAYIRLHPDFIRNGNSSSHGFGT
jgi:Methyltransferase domain